MCNFLKFEPITRNLHFIDFHRLIILYVYVSSRFNPLFLTNLLPALLRKTWIFNKSLRFAKKNEFRFLNFSAKNDILFLGKTEATSAQFQFLLHQHAHQDPRPLWPTACAALPDPIAPKFNFTNSKLKFFLFKLFFLFNYSFTNLSFAGNSHFSFFNVISRGTRIIVFNLKRFLARWLASYDFVFNLQYFGVTRLFFASPLFRQQNLALNWSTSSWDINLWRYFSFFFASKRPSYSRKADFFFKKLKDKNFSFAVVLDSFYHGKNIFYLKRNNYYTFGLIAINENPFLLDFPLFVFFENYLIQSFFLRFLLFVEKQAVFSKYSTHRLLWKNLWNNQLNPSLLNL